MQVITRYLVQISCTVSTLYYLMFSQPRGWLVLLSHSSGAQARLLARTLASLGAVLQISEHVAFAPCRCLRSHLGRQAGRQAVRARSYLIAAQRQDICHRSTTPKASPANPPALDNWIASRNSLGTAGALQPKWTALRRCALVFPFLDFFFARLSSAMMTSKIFALAKDRHGPLGRHEQCERAMRNENHERRHTKKQDHTRDASLSDRPSPATLALPATTPEHPRERDSTSISRSSLVCCSPTPGDLQMLT